MILSPSIHSLSAIESSPAVLIDIDSLTRTGGLRLLLQVLGDGPPELTPMLAAAFLQIADSPRTRAYLRIGCDLEVSLLVSSHITAAILIPYSPRSYCP